MMAEVEKMEAEADERQALALKHLADAERENVTLQ
jgi:hypothetical protein